jgi:hypothetical protein
MELGEDAPCGGETSPEPQAIFQVHPEKGVVPDLAPLGEVIGVAIGVWPVVTKIEIDEHEIGSIGGMRELENRLVIPHASRWDAEIQEIQSKLRARSVQMGFEARHDAVGIGHRAIRKGIAQCHNAEAARWLGNDELFIIQPQSICPIIHMVTVGKNVSGRREVLVQALEDARALAPPGCGQVADLKAEHCGKANSELARQDGEQQSEAQEQCGSFLHTKLPLHGLNLEPVPRLEADRGLPLLLVGPAQERASSTCAAKEHGRQHSPAPRQHHGPGKSNKATVSGLCKGERPDLLWITQHEALPVPSTP